MYVPVFSFADVFLPEVHFPDVSSTSAFRTYQSSFLLPATPKIFQSNKANKFQSLMTSGNQNLQTCLPSIRVGVSACPFSSTQQTKNPAETRGDATGWPLSWRLHENDTSMLSSDTQKKSDSNHILQSSSSNSGRMELFILASISDSIRSGLHRHRHDVDVIPFC